MSQGSDKSLPRLSASVLRHVRRLKLWGESDRVAAAVSGGSDSVALAWILRDLERAGLGRVAGLVHVNHQLRGAEADGDEAFCRELATRLGWPIDIVRVDVGALARDRRQSIEAAARAARYAAFEAAAARLGASVVVTGHTADDQAETVLLRILRGAGTRGLSGVRARRGLYARPLLRCRRLDLRRELARRGEPFREDASNADPAVPRNRLRRELMPVVERLAPGGVSALARLAALAEGDETYLTSVAIETARALVLSRAEGPAGRPVAIDVDRPALGRVPPAIGRRVVRDVLAQVAPEVAPGAGHIQAVWDLVQADKPRGHLDLPGVEVDRRGARLTVRRAAGDVADARRGRSIGTRRSLRDQRPARTLEVPGSVDWPEAGVRITAERARAFDPAHETGRWRASVQAASIEPPLAVRARRPGDRFRPLGSPGRRKVQDVLVDRKVPQDERDKVPVVVDARGRVVWVAGVAVAEECRVTAPEAGVVILELRTTE